MTLAEKGKQGAGSSRAGKPGAVSAPGIASATFADMPEFGVGHATDPVALTGCTAFVARGDADAGVTCGVDVRGGGPATRETDLLKPENMVQAVNAVVIGGGSAFGLEASCGVMEVLAERGCGFAVGPARVPIVPAACLFDLLIGKPTWPDKAMGAEACTCALAFDAGDGDELAQGCVGAGTGATVGKLGRPEQVMKSGFGWSGLKLGGVTVIACVAVNALGNVIAEDGSWLAGVRDADGTIIDPFEAAAATMVAQMGAGDINADATAHAGPCENTTLGVILTNAQLTKAQATKVAQQTQDAYARAIKPVHTLSDGDTVFVMASGRTQAAPDVVGMLATEAMEAAIRSAIRHVAAPAEPPQAPRTATA